jgi:putative endonuclease
MDSRKIFGYYGENLVAKYFEQQGFEIIERNYKIGRKELDLIVRKKKLWIIVEVKSRRSTWVGDCPLKKKQYRTIKKAMTIYLSQNKIAPERAQLDLVILDFTLGSGVKLQHYPKLF